jgi:hypothetical protein
MLLVGCGYGECSEDLFQMAMLMGRVRAIHIVLVISLLHRLLHAGLARRGAQRAAQI